MIGLSLLTEMVASIEGETGSKLSILLLTNLLSLYMSTLKMLLLTILITSSLEAVCFIVIDSGFSILSSSTSKLKVLSSTGVSISIVPL